MKPQKLYKVLKAGRSFLGADMKWSLPKGDKPGEWHEVTGDLVRCRNGLHLTADLANFQAMALKDRHLKAYIAEVDGEKLTYGDEIVARRVRLIQAVEIKQPESSALKLIKLVWEHNREATGFSWTRLNGSMWGAVKLAIAAGMRFGEDDIDYMARKLSLGRWIGETGGEQWYQQAVELGHDSFCRAWESYLSRKPYFFEGRRVHVGMQLAGWEPKTYPTVTSFAADGSHVIACTYKRSESKEGFGPQKIDRRIKITLQEFRARERVLAASKKAPDKVLCLACSAICEVAGKCKCGSAIGMKNGRAGSLVAIPKAKAA